MKIAIMLAGLFIFTITNAFAATMSKGDEPLSTMLIALISTGLLGLVVLRRKRDAE